MIGYLHMPKTGGTSFSVILESSFDPRNCHTHWTIRSTFAQAVWEFARKCIPRLCLGNTAEDISGPLQQADPARV